MADNPLLTRFIETPSLLAPEWAQSMEANFNLLLNMEHGREMLAAGDVGMGEDAFWPDAGSWESNYRPYSVTNGVLNIPVAGTMLNNFSYATNYATGYQYLAKAWARGMADPDVKGIVLSINSGGGEAAGNLDLTDKMAATKCKPVAAICENAYSAAYAIATAADEISVTRTGGAGSVGVLVGHMDVSEAMKQRGVKMTFISAPEGGDKTDGNMYEPLSASARDRMQNRVDELYSHFVGTVSRNRGMEEKAVRATKARTFTASEATSNGLADKVASQEDSLAAFLADLSSSDGAENMSTENKGTVDVAALDAARAEGHTAGHATGHSEGMSAGRTAERERISAILSSDVAKARPALAHKIAFAQSQSAEDAIAFMADLPAEVLAAAAPAAATHAKPEFKEGMNAQGGANVAANTEAGNGAAAGSDENKADAASALAIASSMGIPGLRSTQKLMAGQ